MFAIKIIILKIIVQVIYIGGTQKMNMSQASQDGRMVSKIKGLPKKLSDLQISYIPKLFERGFSYRDISYIFNREASTATIKRWHFLYIKKYGL